MKLHKLYMTSLLTITALSVSSVAVTEQEIPTDADPIYYLLGGEFIPKPVSYSNTVRLQSTLGAGFGYTCGQFDPYHNAEQIINGWEEQVEALPDMFMGAVEGYVASLPGYLLNKANPALYQTVKSTLDKTFELYEASFKSCQQIEREVAEGKNPYHNLVRASIGERWEVEAGNAGITNSTIRQVQKKTQTEAGKDGIQISEGKSYGGEGQDPIRMNHFAAILGYNILIQRSPADLESTASGYEDQPVFDVWESPLDAANWITSTVGDEEIMTDGTSVVSKSGKGMKTEVAQLTVDIRAALEKAVLENDYEDIRQYSGATQFNRTLIDPIRAMDAFEQSAFIDRIASTTAVLVVKDKVFKAKRLLYAGIQHPDVIQGSAGDSFNTRVREKTIVELNDQLKDIIFEMEIDSAIPNVALKVFEYDASRTQGAFTNSSVPSKKVTPLNDGSVSSE